MENQSFMSEIHLFAFSSKPDYSTLIACLFLFLYIFGVLINSTVIIVININDHLHTAMYLFLCNLALVDICYTTTIVPNLLYMLLSGDNAVSFMQCLTQMFFYLMVAFTEDILIFIMAYDRYVAICQPLHYHNILKRNKCLLLASGSWILGCLNSLLLTVKVSHVSFCNSNTISQFFCDIKALYNISCSGREELYIFICVEAFIFGFFPVIFSLASYVKIIRVVLQIKSTDSRSKAFSTCSSHLTIITIYCVTALSVYMMPSVEHNDMLEPVFTVLYAIITPMLNPLIYSLRNKDVKKALLRLLGGKVMY